MSTKNKTINEELFNFIKSSPTAFHATKEISSKLCEAGFSQLEEKKAWNIKQGGSYYVVRNSSSVIAFSIGKKMKTPAFRVIASHSDSPMFKVKENAEIIVHDRYVQLDTEGYGGMINYSWLDRPLSLAGRIVIRAKGHLEERLVAFDEPTVLIPSLAIHMNRKVNEGVELNKQKDMIALYGLNGEKTPKLRDKIAKECGVLAKDILGMDIFVYNHMEGTVWGADREYISAPRLDDLMCAYASLRGFIDNKDGNYISVYCCFDNEEVGSKTRQGADSSMLSDTLQRIGEALGWTKEEYHIAIANSLMLSEDNGHAVHPSHPEKSDQLNRVYMNEGIVVKSHAGQKYASDAVGVAICRDICDRNDIPVQFFSNRSDEVGGSTLGNLAISNVPIRTVDIGLAQLAMHSSYETAGANDTEYMKRFSEAFYGYEE